MADLFIILLEEKPPGEKIPAVEKYRSKTRKNPKSAESVNTSVASSGSACDLASLGFEFSFLLFFGFARRVLGSAERSYTDLYQDKHTPRCQKEEELKKK